MRRFLLVLLLAGLVFLWADVDRSRIERYSGKNAAGLLELVDSSEGKKLEYVEFLLSNSSVSDLAILTAEYLEKNITYAQKAREIDYAQVYDETIFKHFVLPHRMSQEPLENWREVYFEELQPLVSEAKDLAEAAILVNIWCLEQMTYKPTHGRDQSAFTSAKRGYGRCEEMMIIYMCAARAVGIPVRSCSAPYWNFTNSNHAWIEVWTTDGWKYLGEPASSLSKTWFTNTTQRATLITAKAFGNYDHANVIKQSGNVTTLSSIEYYTDSYELMVEVEDASGNPVEGAIVTPMAVSFGGLWGLTQLETDAEGRCRLPLGKGSVLLLAGKDELAGWQMVSNLDGEDLFVSIELDPELNLEGEFSFLFPIPGSNPLENEEPDYFGDKFGLMRENADLKRDKRLNSQKHTADFAKYYDLVKQEDKKQESYFSERKEFLNLCDELAANADDFVHVLDKSNADERWVICSMLESWDIKDLCEIPDSVALESLVKIYAEGRKRYSAGDSLFAAHCLARTWHSASPVQNNWQSEFYELLKAQISQEIDSTVNNICDWIDEEIEIDDEFEYTYYSTGLNPLQILNLHYVPEFYRTKLVNSSLKLAGIPVRWEGQLEYYSSEGSWEEIPGGKEEEEESTELAEFCLSIYVDDQQVKADPYENFFIAALGQNGDLSNIWFDGENDSLEFCGRYRITETESPCVEAVIRNSNGDAEVKVKAINTDEKEITIYLTTPREYLDISTRWDKELLESVKKPWERDEEQKTVIVVLGEKSTEPQVHTMRFLAEKLARIEEQNARVCIYGEKRSLAEYSRDEIWSEVEFQQGKAVLNEELEAEDYPAIFIFDPAGELIFSTSGYNMGIADLIVKKLK